MSLRRAVSTTTAASAAAVRRAPPSLPVMRVWGALARLPLGLGSYLFSFLVRWAAPYSASVDPRVRELRPGFCRAEITERWWLRNPFFSIHALALANVGELATGLMVMETLRLQGLRGIVTGLRAEYFKKAKGTVAAVAEMDVEKPLLSPGQDEGTYEVVAKIVDADNQLLARISVNWNIRRL